MRLFRFSMAFVCLSLAGVSTSEAAVLENDSLRLSVDDSGKVSVLDKKSNTTWSQADVLKTEDSATSVTQPLADTVPTIKSVKQDGDAIVIEAGWQVPLTMRWMLRDGDEIALEIRSSKAEDKVWDDPRQGPLLYPPPFYSSVATYTAMPRDEGCLYETARIDPKVDGPRWNLDNVMRNLSMPWWGETDLKQGMMTLLDTPFHAAQKTYVCQTPDGERALPTVNWLGDRGAWGAPRKVTFRVIREGGYVAMAKRFRAEMKKQGLFRSFEEKCKNLPQMAKLKGAMDLWIFAYDRQVTAEDVKRVHDCGFDKLLLQVIGMGTDKEKRGFTPEAIKQANEYGYLTGYYHLLSWMYRPKTGDYPPEQKGVAIKTATGIYEAGHNVWGTHALYCPLVLGDRLASTAKTEHENGLSVFFTDCTIAGDSVRDCYDPKHPLTIPQCVEALRNDVGQISRQGMLPGSERGFWYATKTCAWFEGVETIINYFSRFQGPTPAETHSGPMQNQRPGFKELFVDHNYGPQNRVPLFQLVFHDSVYCTRRWDDHHTRQPELWRMNDLMAICYGVAPIITFHHQIGPHILRDSFEPFRERYQRTYKEVCGWHEQIGFEEMTEHTFLTADRKVQQTTFANGKSVIVNFSDQAYQTGDGKTVAGMGFLESE